AIQNLPHNRHVETKQHRQEWHFFRSLDDLALNGNVYRGQEEGTRSAEVGVSSEAHALFSLYENREAGLDRSAIAGRGLGSAKKNQTGNRRGMLSDRWCMRKDSAD